MNDVEPISVDTLPLTIGGCRRLAELGRGGMGTVFRAQQLSMAREVALKIIHPAFATDRLACERFVREIRSAGAVSCPQLVSCHDAGTDHGILYLVMELITGGDAGQLIRRDGPLGPAQATAILRDAACGVRALHAVGLLHRDIKLSNIFLADTGAKLADLGLARRVDEDQPVTLTGAMVGTPAFMSPEQALGQTVDERTDIYALGATLYALLAGQAPFLGSSPLAVAARVIDSPFPDPRSVSPRTPPALAALVLRACSKDRDARPRDAATFIAELDQARLTPPSSATQPTLISGRPAPRATRQVARRKNRPTRVWAWAGVATLLMLVTAGMAWRSPANASTMVEAPRPTESRSASPVVEAPLPVEPRLATPVEAPLPAQRLPASPAPVVSSVDRRHLDARLRIVSGRHLPLFCLHAFATPDERAALKTELRGETLIALRLAGRDEVFATHPLREDAPASIDFSAITGAGAGVLRLSLRGHDRGICRVIVKRDGQDLERIEVPHGTWIDRDIAFDRQPVTVIHEPVGWVNAFLAVTYRIE